ncbi:hypothetical protein Pst134EA_025659 [Puccinia striiformis f. sp. tritici]|uniref:Uncharacterized protein n=1 Tax=Puccinia striiformis f. sp. tritici PST-78 TaxID=1165861 RepID=A0A0L0V1D9_9BASI|nr:hypothetical protein Pst134EA_025659 [Puccinia striiformis f. sp. tritici]KAH9451719.1 hypothetical protein Pst134EA_025659 [Puccinia striiformis f. sp. tritici]KAI9618534.1 hypothetical protein H4Q26_012355 [Puccinia striiformis f. sp. tritici PST-130]KNE93080.1 hypothetical protein PSTG_13571 [Puccinia striiformis f. sp. tritici PST-78]
MVRRVDARILGLTSQDIITLLRDMDPHICIPSKIIKADLQDLATERLAHVPLEPIASTRRLRRSRVPPGPVLGAPPGRQARASLSPRPASERQRPVRSSRPSLPNPESPADAVIQPETSRHSSPQPGSKRRRPARSSRPSLPNPEGPANAVIRPEPSRSSRPPRPNPRAPAPHEENLRDSVANPRAAYIETTRTETTSVTPDHRRRVVVTVTETVTEPKPPPYFSHEADLQELHNLMLASAPDQAPEPIQSNKGADPAPLIDVETSLTPETSSTAETSPTAPFQHPDLSNELLNSLENLLFIPAEQKACTSSATVETSATASLEHALSNEFLVSLENLLFLPAEPKSCTTTATASSVPLTHHAIDLVALKSPIDNLIVSDLGNTASTQETLDHSHPMEWESALCGTSSAPGPELTQSTRASKYFMDSILNDATSPVQMSLNQLAGMRTEVRPTQAGDFSSFVEDALAKLALCPAQAKKKAETAPEIGLSTLSPLLTTLPGSNSFFHDALSKPHSQI